jgi:hypothetical protein
MNLNWHKSYLYKITKEEKLFNLPKNTNNEKKIIEHILKSLNLYILPGKINLSENSMVESIHKCLRNVDPLTSPYFDEKSKTFVPQMRTDLCHQIYAASLGDMGLRPYWNGISSSTLNDLRSKISVKPRSEKPWQLLPSWAPELFAEKYKCNIMIVDVGISSRSNDYGLDVSDSKNNNKVLPLLLNECAVRCASVRVFDPRLNTIYMLCIKKTAVRDNHYEALAPDNKREEVANKTKSPTRKKSPLKLQKQSRA